MRTLASMSRFLLLHGAGGIGFDHWLVWLSEELRARGHQAHMRKLPSPKAPMRAPWHAAMTERFEALGSAAMSSGFANLEQARTAPTSESSGELVVVAHSLGTLLWLLHAADVAVGRTPPPAVLADRVALVAPPKLPDELGDSGWSMPVAAETDPSSVANSTRFAVSRNDRYWPNGGSIPALVEPLGLPLDDLGDAGHVEPADGYGPWPSMLAWCLGEAEAITPN